MLTISKHNTPFHNSCKSSTRGCCKKISMSLPDCLGLGIGNVNIIFFFFMHNHRGKIYVTSITSQQLYLLLKLEKGLKPSVASPNLKLRKSIEKYGHFMLINSHITESTRCCILPSLLFWFECHNKFSTTS